MNEKTPHTDDTTACAASKLTVKLDPPMPSHAELLRLLGEVDGIELRSVNEHSVAVFVVLGGKKIELIRDCGEVIDHHITRTGIARCIVRSNAEITGADRRPG